MTARLFHNYPWVVDVPDDIPPAFDCVALSPLRRAHDEDWTDPDTGEFYPAPMDYRATMTARRISNGGYFYVPVVLDKDFAEWPKDKQAPYLKFKIDVAIEYLKTFADCSCVPDQPCPQHARSKSAPSVDFR